MTHYHQYIAELCVCDKFSEFYTALLCSLVLKKSDISAIFMMQQTTNCFTQ